MQRARLGILGLLGLSTGLMACPFASNGLGTPFGNAGGSGGAGLATTSSSQASTGGSGPATMVCTPGATQPCYDGLVGTTDAGAPCSAGKETCEQNGLGWGACLDAVMPAADNCASGNNLHCDNPPRTCTGTLAGGVTAGEPGTDQGLSVAVDLNSNAIVGGFFHDTVDFGGGNKLSVPGMPTNPDPGSDGFVAKITPAGTTVWAQDFGGMGDDQVNAVAVDPSGNVFVVGSYASSVAFAPGPAAKGPGMFLVKLGPTGTFAWGQTYPGGTIVPEALAVAPDGHLAVAGYFSGTCAFSPPPAMPLKAKGGSDGFVLEVDQAGTLAWIKQVSDSGGNPQSEVLYGVTIDPGNAVVVTGAGAGTVDFGNGAGVAVPGNGKGLALAKYAGSTGALAWEYLLGNGTDSAAGYAIAVDVGGNLYVTGAFQGALTLGTVNLVGPSGVSSSFVAQFGPSGMAGWSTAFAPPSGGSGSSQGYGLAVDTYSVVMAGEFSGQLAAASGMLTSLGSTDALVAKLNLTRGEVLWTQQLGGSGGNDAAISVALDPTPQDPLGKSVVTGYFSGPISLGGTTPSTSQGSDDIFVARLAP